MIAGIGTDIVSVSRVRSILNRFPDRFAKKILSENEFADFTRCTTRAAFLAKRFAAKEAAVKALGTGFRQGVEYRDITVSHDAHGRPMLVFTGVALRKVSENKITNSHLSISDERDHAVAFVVLEYQI